MKKPEQLESIGTATETESPRASVVEEQVDQKVWKNLLGATIGAALIAVGGLSLASVSTLSIATLGTPIGIFALTALILGGCILAATVYKSVKYNNSIANDRILSVEPRGAGNLGSKSFPQGPLPTTQPHKTEERAIKQGQTNMPK